ncbi:MAG: hypothetical protein QM767_02185 [Anaeromyxobacter sp.]
MRFRLETLRLAFAHSEELIAFDDFTYFFGQMGAGKSSIARLVDYCLGADLDFTPALQSEFSAAELTFVVNDTPISVYRERGSGQVRARWARGGDRFDAVLPARNAGGVVVPGTKIEVLSDLVFQVAGIDPPRVLRSKASEDPESTRLTLRNLLWYCYLDQESMDSSFFHLERDANPFKRNQSKDALRFIVGIHQQKVAELEAGLEDARTERLRHEQGARALEEVLKSAGISSESELREQIGLREKEITALGRQITALREGAAPPDRHAIDRLREQGRALVGELEAAENALSSLDRVVPDEVRQRNELKMLTVKADRTVAASNVLAGFHFAECPLCAQSLPERPNAHCRVCGQSVSRVASRTVVADVDLKSRLAELDETIERRQSQRAALARRRVELADKKRIVDNELSTAISQYDSKLVAETLALEQRRSALQEQIVSLARLSELPRAVTEQLKRRDAAIATELGIKRDLKTARDAAERDAGNLRRLEELFLDCVVRAGIPGFMPDDDVHIDSRSFMPIVTPNGDPDIVVSSFENLGSGGKKTLFKCCFAIAVHRLAREIEAPLPSLLIIDSPMKNISERENRTQFEGFHSLLYSLAMDDLRGTQFVLIDKEYAPPSDDIAFGFTARHMTPSDEALPPLISYYRGH